MVDKMENDRKSGRIKDLEDALAGVEVAYARWLGTKENIHTGLKPDSLSNYFRYFYTDEGIQFYVKDGLPTEVKNACWSAFKGVFVNKS